MNILEIGLENGLKRGLEQGQKAGEQRMASLIQQLVNHGRNEDISKAALDEQYREKMYQEYHL